jgi:hypothetical protein
MTLPEDGEGPNYRLFKYHADDSVILIARDDETGKILGGIRFSSTQEARDVANAIMDTVLDPPKFRAWNISLHG